MKEMKCQKPESVTNRKGVIVAHFFGFAVFLLLQGLGSSGEDLVLSLFAKPAGYFSAFFLGVPLDSSSGILQLLHPRIDVAITDACSGFDFFCLITALWIGWTVYRSRGSRKHYFWLPFILPASWGITLVGNVSRIVCATQIQLLTPESMATTFDGIIHQTVGVIVFLSVLILFWKTLTIYHERFYRI